MKCGIRSKSCVFSGEKLSKFCISDDRQGNLGIVVFLVIKASVVGSVCASFMHNSTFFKTHLLTQAAGDVNIGIGQSCACHNCLNASIKNQKKWQNVVQHNISKNTVENWELQTYSPICLQLWIFLGGGVYVLKFFGGLFFFFWRWESFSVCQWSLKVSLLPTVVTGLHLACAAFRRMQSVTAWIVCRAVKHIWICHHSEEYHATFLNNLKLKGEVFNVWKLKLIPLFGCN